jgi:tetratricopeptide (TPR) repeat protein
VIFYNLSQGSILCCHALGAFTCAGRNYPLILLKRLLYMLINFLHKPAYHLLLVLILGILGYSNTLNAPFQFDDTPNIVNNPIIKNLDYYITPAEAKSYKDFAEYPLLINRYIGSLTFALNYKINKLDVTGYHVVNILIHLINSVLIYWFVHLTFIILASGAGGNNPGFRKHASTIAFFTSLLFVTHPIQTQAVTYIVQRFASLATMFYFFSIIMYIKFRSTSNDSNSEVPGKNISARALVYYVVALFAAVLAMKTKEIAFTLPAMIALYEFLFFKGEIKNRILYLVPFILTMLIIPATIIYIVGVGGGTATRLATDMPRLDYLSTEFRVIITYIRLIFLPVAQNLDYDYPLYHSLFGPEVFLSFLALLLICLTVIYFFWHYKKILPLTRVIFFGTAWFFATLSIESSIIPIKDVIFEHRMYLPSFGIFLGISALLVMIIERCRQKWVEGTVFLAVILTALVFTGLTYSRNNVWTDNVALWQDVVNKSPGKARGIANLGVAHAEQGNLDRAIKYYKKAISVAPSYAQAYLNLGQAYLDKGFLNESIKAYENAININPINSEAYNNLGTAYLDKGLIDESIKSFQKAIDINPSDAFSHYNLGCAYFDKGLIDESVKSYRKAINIDPSHASAHYNLGGAYMKQGLIKEAEIEMKRASILEKQKSTM